MLGQALFAVFGSCARWLSIKDKRKMRLLSLISEAVSAAFAGVLVYCIYSWLNMNIYIAFCIAGIIGHQGARGLDMLGQFIMKNSGLKGMSDKDEGN